MIIIVDGEEIKSVLIDFIQDKIVQSGCEFDILMEDSERIVHNLNNCSVHFKLKEKE